MIRTALLEMTPHASLRLLIEWIRNERKPNCVLDTVETVKAARNALESIGRMVGREDDNRVAIPSFDSDDPYLYRVCLAVASYLSHVTSWPSGKVGDHFIPRVAGAASTVLRYNDWSLILPIVVWERDTEFARLIIEKGAADVNVDVRCFGFPVHIAAYNNDVEMLSLLLDNGGDIRSREDIMRGITPLHVAVGQGAKDTTELLLERGAPINDEDFRCQTCLEKAISMGHDDIAHALLRRPGVDPNNGGGYQCRIQNALVTAISLQKQSIIEALLEREDIDLRRCGHKRHTPLYFATVVGNTKAIDRILERDPSLTTTVAPFYLCKHAIKHGDLDRLRSLLAENRRKVSGRAHRTLIFKAVAEGRVDMAKVLLESNDKVNLGDCLYQAAAGDDPDVMEWALGKYDEYRGNPNRQPQWQAWDLNRAIGRAGSEGNYAVLKILLARKDADVNAPHARLEEIIRRGRTESVRLLLEMRADTDYREQRDGDYLLTHAIMYGRRSIVELLLRKGDLDVNGRTHSKLTPLMLAARAGQASIVRLLLKRDDVDIDAEDRDGNTALNLAVKEGYRDLVAVLENDKRARDTLKRL